MVTSNMYKLISESDPKIFETALNEALGKGYTPFSEFSFKVLNMKNYHRKHQYIILLYKNE